MKKIINGKKYDTETAKWIGGRTNGLYSNDLYYFSEDLYQKRTGELFLYGEGGPGSKYSSPCGAGWTCGDEVIIPFSLKEAKKWGEKYLNVDVYESLFGEVVE